MARPNVDLSFGVTSQQYWKEIDPQIDRPLTLWGPCARFRDVRPVMPLRSPAPTETGTSDAWMYA